MKSKTIKPEKEFDINSFKLTDLPNVGPLKEKRLKEAGVRTPFDILVMGSLELSIVSNMDKEDAVNLVNKVRTKLEDAKVIIKKDSVQALRDHRAKQFHLPSKCNNLDSMMRGGVESQSCTELYAPEGAGKTQYVGSLVMECISNGIPVYYIGCEGTIGLERLEEIAKARGLTPNWDLLQLDEVEDTDRLETIIDHACGKVLENGIKLIVVDGAVGLYRLENDRGRGQLAQRQNDIKPIIRHLRGIADYLNVAVLFTNQVMDNPDGGMYGGDPIKAIGGHIVGHYFKYIIKFNKGGKNKRSATFVKSHMDALQNVEFWLNASGVSDQDLWDMPTEGMKEVNAKIGNESALVDKSVLLES